MKFSFFKIMLGMSACLSCLDAAAQSAAIHQSFAGGAASERYGVAIAAQGNLIAIGDSHDASQNKGKVSVYRMSDAAVVSSKTGSATWQHFGASLSFVNPHLGNFLVIGVPQLKNTSNVQVGGIQLYDIANNSIAATTFGSSTSSRFGNSLATLPGPANSNSYVAVGIPFDSNGSGGTIGRVKVYEVSASGFSLKFTLTAPSSSTFGQTLASIGDLSGDGRAELAVGLPNHNSGQVRIYNGATGALLNTIRTPTPNYTSQFGFAVAGGKDLNSDGVPDLVIGAPLQKNSQAQVVGAVYLVSGASMKLLRKIFGTTLNNQPDLYGRFGAQVAIAGDIDGNGSNEVLAAAPMADPAGKSSAGLIKIFSRNLNWGMSSSIAGQIADAQEGNAQYDSQSANQGGVVAAGDFNADGKADIVTASSLDGVVRLFRGQ